MEENQKIQLIYSNIIKINKYKKKLEYNFKEPKNINTNYCVNLKFSSENKIIIEIYSEENPFNQYFKSILTLDDLIKINSNFKSYSNITEIYKIMNNIMNKGNYDIKNNNDSNSFINLVLPINNEQIQISLKKENIAFDANNFF